VAARVLGWFVLGVLVLAVGLAGGVYLWESRAAAEQVYSGEWRERVTKLYGNAPQVTYFDTPVIVDNSAGGAITKAA